MAEKKKAKTGSFFDPKAFKDSGDAEQLSGKTDDVKWVSELRHNRKLVVWRFVQNVCVFS